MSRDLIRQGDMHGFHTATHVSKPAHVWTKDAHGRFNELAEQAAIEHGYGSKANVVVPVVIGGVGLLAILTAVYYATKPGGPAASVPPPPPSPVQAPAPAPVAAPPAPMPPPPPMPVAAPPPPPVAVPHVPAPHEAAPAAFNPGAQFAGTDAGAAAPAPVGPSPVSAEGAQFAGTGQSLDAVQTGTSGD